jgi:1-deoxy-D-xylulose-5-phosphate synthase
VELFLSLLSRVNFPGDLKALSMTQLQQLAAEVRREIIATVSTNGGHLAPNLGVVELTLALHRAFRTPEDKIIWDVGHQCYTHKLVTGRKEEFRTLRQYGGISGFPRPEESPYDAFATGHSSTSISAGLGMAVARDLLGEKHAVVAVIGDGALTAGMAFEALNHAGHLQKDLVVVLNDNEMSISKNVGALARYLTRLRTEPVYSRSKEEIEQLLRKIPAIGPAVVKAVEKLKDSLKYLVVPGMFFEELGFKYLGPVDGHNIPEMIAVFEQSRAAKGPVLVHVITQKGKGYPPAEAKADKFHGIGPFSVETGKSIGLSSPPTYTEVFGKTIVSLAQENEKITAITAAMPSGTGLAEFAKAFPERFFDVGIAEQHAVTLAAGLAAAGLRPVVAIYSTFLQRAFDQVLHDVCLQNLPVTFAVDRAGLVGDDGPTHHGVFDFAFLRPIPNMVIMSPKDEDELRHMLKTALSHNGPAAVRYPREKGTGCSLDGEPEILPIGKAQVLRDGSDAALFAVGTMVKVALESAEMLAGHGLQVAVINARFVKPVDEECVLRYALKTGLLFTIEEHVLQGGFGSAILEVLADRGRLSSVEVVRLGIGDTFVEHGGRDILLARLGLTAENVARLVLSASRRKNRKSGKDISGSLQVVRDDRRKAKERR